MTKGAARDELRRMIRHLPLIYLTAAAFMTYAYLRPPAPITLAAAWLVAVAACVIAYLLSKERRAKAASLSRKDLAEAMRWAAGAVESGLADSGEFKIHYDLCAILGERTSEPAEGGVFTHVYNAARANGPSGEA